MHVRVRCAQCKSGPHATAPFRLVAVFEAAGFSLLHKAQMRVRVADSGGDFTSGRKQIYANVVKP